MLINNVRKVKNNKITLVLSKKKKEIDFNKTF